MRRTVSSTVLFFAGLSACAAPEKSGGLDPAPVLDGLIVSPISVTVNPGDSVPFSAVGHFTDGTTHGVTVSWASTGGSMSATGTYRAGPAPGGYLVIVVTPDFQFADTASIVIADTGSGGATLTGLTVQPAAVTVDPGSATAFNATASYSNGSTAPVVATWSATGGAVTQAGSYQAGPAAGAFRVIAAYQGRADTAQVSIRDTTGTGAPTLTGVTVQPGVVTVDPGTVTAFSATGSYSDGSTAPVGATWSATGGSVSPGGSYQAGPTAGAFRVIAAYLGRADTAQVSIRDTTTPPPPPPPGTVLFTEGFDDAGVGARGWYDNISPAVALTGQHGGSGALQMAFNAGGVTPVKGGAVRHKFTGTDRLYVRYWVKYSSSFVGSGTSSHPHEFHVLTNLDGDYVGPSATHLSISFEHNWSGGGGVPRLAQTDALNIDQSRPNQNLVNVTEVRAAAGCNGNGDAYPTGCYQQGGQWRNEKIWSGGAPTFTHAAGPGDKTQWHQVEVYFQLNSISGGKGVADGIAQYWFDGQLKMDKQNVLFRTGQYPTMQFTQLMVAPYIGNGSPVAQTLWVDDLTVATGPVP